MPSSGPNEASPLPKETPIGKKPMTTYTATATKQATFAGLDGEEAGALGDLDAPRTVARKPLWNPAPKAAYSRMALGTTCGIPNVCDAASGSSSGAVRCGSRSRRGRRAIARAGWIGLDHERPHLKAVARR